MSGASTNTGSNGLHHPVPPQGGSQTRPEYIPRPHGENAPSSAPGYNGIINHVPTTGTTGHYQAPYNNQVQAGQNGSTNRNIQAGGMSSTVPAMGRR
ncbi:hypothetical protein SETIT_6G122000v2 [Setaria italica]|uniref:Uncharacterized protein n=2 Tax=Setaria TaxID=4554 RepID=A0A368RMF1_SETIT|nr:hypothetical protein SETIT_6G122000v2 [Setaria italica]TKW09902.1 hypothetical protein SEVIR_6G131500v2 [Setaria viridis]